MSGPARYLFDSDFGATYSPRRAEAAPPTVLLSQHVEEVRRADEVGFLRGLEEGRARAEADIAARLAGATQRLALVLRDLSTRFEDTAERHESEAARLAIALARKIAGAALARFPLAELEAIARETFAEMRSAPHVVVRVEATMVEAVTPLLERIAREAGFLGKLVVLGEDGEAAGTIRIEWADGGAVRDQGAIEAAIEAMARRIDDLIAERTA